MGGPGLPGRGRISAHVRIDYDQCDAPPKASPRLTGHKHFKMSIVIHTIIAFLSVFQIMLILPGMQLQSSYLAFLRSKLLVDILPMSLPSCNQRCQSSNILSYLKGKIIQLHYLVRYLQHRYRRYSGAVITKAAYSGVSILNARKCQSRLRSMRRHFRGECI
eukprot:1567593-Pleurochrysis_carterae.AAC.1